MKIILTVSILAFSMGTAGACEFQRTAQKTDATVTASISVDQAAQMSTPALPAPQQAEKKPVLLQDE